MTVEPPPLDGAIVVVAKCPVPGKCKTRLTPLLGSNGSAQLAKAMLCDILKTLSTCTALRTVSKILLYAPSDEHGRLHMFSILQEIGLVNDDDDDDDWILMPMLAQDLGTSDLSKILCDALHCARLYLHRRTSNNNNNNCNDDNDNNTTISQEGDGGVVFLGMDAPELPMDDIMTALRFAKCSGSGSGSGGGGGALLCPAADGGYGMLSVPAHADATKIFDGVLWSHSLTAVSQIKSLTDCDIVVKLGRLMHDVDEPEDVHQLCQRLQLRQQHTTGMLSSSSSDGGAVLQKPSFSLETMKATTTTTSWFENQCYYTRDVLTELGLLKER